MKDYLIVQHNELLEASYCLSVNEQRLLLACISQVDSRVDMEFDFTKGITLTLEQSQDLFYTEKSKKNAYVDLKSACEKLFRREVRFKSENGRFETLLRWISSVEFDNQDNIATLYFSKEIQPYISNLSSNFTKYRVKNIVHLTSKYSIRIYELIVSWQCKYQNYKEMEIIEFRELLDLGGKYKQHGELNRYVINTAVKEINEYTDFELEIKFKKRGRSFKWVQLSFKQKTNHTLNEELRKEKRDTKTATKTAVIDKQKKQAVAKVKVDEYQAFAEGLIIDIGMKFWCEKLKLELVVDENIAITDKRVIEQYKGKHGLSSPIYFLQAEDIKRLIFAKELRQNHKHGNQELF